MAQRLQEYDEVPPRGAYYARNDIGELVLIAGGRVRNIGAARSASEHGAAGAPQGRD
jgi:hypothetical protein